MRSIIPRIILIAGSAGIIVCSGPTVPEPIKREPLITIAIGSDSVLNGQIVSIPVTIQWHGTADAILDSLESLDLLICYDNRYLSFIDADRGDGVSEWEYFTYRHSDSLVKKASSVHVVAWRNLVNGVAPDPPQYIPQGTVFRMHFFVTSDREHIGRSAWIGFCAVDCNSNALSPNGSKDTLLVQYHDDSDPDFHPMYDTANCPRRFVLHPIVEFQDGHVYIKAPAADHVLIGDIDLNGVAMEVSDAVLFTNYFIHGESVFETDPVRRAMQIAATDINGDGVPLTWEDLQAMVRVIDGP